jgi:primary-amine oxidase
MKFRRLVRTLTLGAAVLFCATASRALVEEPPPRPGSGNLVQWEGWSFRWAIRPREGLVLTEVKFRDRQVMKYAGLEEIFVPYDQGQPRPEDSLDGMGTNIQTLVPGTDCLPGTVCRMYDAQGRLSTRPVVGIHEEPTGLLYVGPDGARATGKMLVVWCSSRLGNYVYFTRWRFRSDGVFMPQAGLTGKLEHTRPGTASDAYGTVVQRAREAGVYAPSHVHNFYYRLDLDVDGPENDVVEEFNHRQVEPRRSLRSADGWTPLLTETSRPLSAETFRTWRVVDRGSTNANGHPRSWELIPGGNGVFRGAASEAFTHGDFWVTRYRPSELPLSASDPRPIKRALPAYVNGESVAGEDVVIWYVMHVHHVPRTEDWPAMPVVFAGFELHPRDVLDSSPLHPQLPNVH